jgi:hypothetical protein
MTKIPDYDTELAAVTACITALAEHGIPVDIQEVLVNGSLQAGIKPHAIFNGIRAAYNTYQSGRAINYGQAPGLSAPTTK